MVRFHRAQVIEFRRYTISNGQAKTNQVIIAERT